ncbi:TWiK family of potassium channels protein 7-like [Penaeus japonicus]|uniref:TWiK family of potassium channels protein 7-like n=1 Tax=Penaeus japonicus TaxID=27405 RepID=UPI001C712CB8|nr:TWiK family of potassium channels protein 7-like [Penaeus japonicus]
MEMDEFDSGKQKTKETSPSKIFVHLLFSHFGIFIIVAIYAAIGAYAFVEIELPHEERLYEIKQEKAVEVNQTMNYMANLFWFYQDKNWTLDSFNTTVYKDLKKLESFIISAVQNYKYDGTVMDWDYSWTFPNSLLLTMTIMSTIGYGHISPVTSWGQFFCIIYSIVGCPLLLVFLGNLGTSMAESFTYIYSRCCCRWCRGVRNMSELPPKASKKQRKLLIDDEIGKEEYMPTEEVDVPITLTLVVLFVYIMLGAVLFSVWENWDLGSSSYFTFVTLSTIGYGDMVPGTALLDNKNPGTAGLKMAVCIGYILLGMALLSMCLNLMQEQIIEKCRWLAREIGLSGKDNVEETKDAKKKKNLDDDHDKKLDDLKDLEKAPPTPPKDTLSVPGSAGSARSLLTSSTQSIPGALDDL